MLSLIILLIKKSRSTGKLGLEIYIKKNIDPDYGGGKDEFRSEITYTQNTKDFFY